ncbi:hydroxyacid dehydrogenase [Brenneria goodwinii]|uniref:D-3-phosphoglycerate dehydrogenase n=1 Tax=Brenneria goodwinii TaxID=1109412 RepID=A0A0G4JU28_9GAMM|nr:2-hydroxyacid dehydrogenase [Brenneria goodwinii]ATA26014.1 hydroxyacid dehydrogenase [Brenneria goodwinii]RLM21879.1 hydroxyacid dehydrogenase [Brenneria goodwinii]CPR15657.1 D-3-phosphoglycerate dehydrogenase [Brenneria goodwinii]
MKQKILKQASLPAQLDEELNARYDVYEYAALAPSEFSRLAEEFRVVITNGEAVVTREFINALPNLALIAVFGVGYDGVDVPAAKARGIAVTHTPGVLTDDVADLALGLLLATSRQIADAQTFIQQGGWKQQSYMWTRKVSGSTLGIIGLGRIGRAVAQRAAGFNLAISYTDRQPANDVDFTFYPTVEALAAASDYLVVCTPGGSDTHCLVNRDVLRALGSDGMLINISRGSVVDEQALVEAIEQGTIAGAGLDVFAHEPDVPAGLLGKPNVVVTPHMASATWSTRREMSRLVMENVDAWFAGQPLVTPVP